MVPLATTAGLTEGSACWCDGRRVPGRRGADTTLQSFIGSVVRYGVVIIGLVAILQQLGVQATSIDRFEVVAEELRAAWVARMKLLLARVSGLWAREGNLFLNARDGQRRELDGESWTELQGVRLYEFDDDGRLLSLAQAQSAEHRNGQWRLKDVRRSRFGERSVEVETHASQAWTTALGDEVVSSAVARPRYLSSAELQRNITYLERNGLDAKAFENAYWARWFYPLNVVVLCLSALPFAFGSLRSGGFGKRLFIAIVIGIAYLLAQRLVVSLSDVYRFDARLAYLLPPLALVAVSWGLFARRE